MTIKCHLVYDPEPSEPFDPRTILSRLACEDVELTDEHAASNYAQPVLIWKDMARGPAELPSEASIVFDPPTFLEGGGIAWGESVSEEERELLSAALALGYPLSAQTRSNIEGG